jgi:hypothetical protein
MNVRDYASLNQQRERTGTAEAREMLEEEVRRKGSSLSRQELEGWWRTQCQERSQTMFWLGVPLTEIGAWMKGCYHVYREARQIAPGGTPTRDPAATASTQALARPTVGYDEVMAPLIEQGVEIWGKNDGIAMGYFAQITLAPVPLCRRITLQVKLAFADGYQHGYQAGGTVASRSARAGEWVVRSDDRAISAQIDQVLPQGLSPEVQLEWRRGYLFGHAFVYYELVLATRKGVLRWRW